MYKGTGVLILISHAYVVMNYLVIEPKNQSHGTEPGQARNPIPFVSQVAFFPLCFLQCRIAC